jgi:hypothetical protein
MSQRGMMRKLVRDFGEDEEMVVGAYAEAELQGRVNRSSNLHDLTPEEYARALWRDGQRKGWIVRYRAVLKAETEIAQE